MYTYCFWDLVGGFCNLPVLRRQVPNSRWLLRLLEACLLDIIIFGDTCPLETAARVLQPHLRASSVVGFYAVLCADRQACGMGGD
jgi:hypothetical protein